MFDELKTAMNAAGIDPTHAPMIADGSLRRFYLPGDRSKSKNGHIILFDNGDGTYGAGFGDWKRHIKESWFSGKPFKELNADEKRQFAQKMATAKAKQEEERQRQQAAAAAKAAHLWQRAHPASTCHAYLDKKHVQVHGIKQLGSSLVIPVRNISGFLTGLQFIDLEGNKVFLRGTAVNGCYHAMGPQPKTVVLLAEGYATAATLFEATGYPCAVAFFAGNLKPVALALREKFPLVKMVICADADPVGRAAAKEAASAVHGTWLEPDFSESEAII